MPPHDRKATPVLHRNQPLSQSTFADLAIRTPTHTATATAQKETFKFKFQGYRSPTQNRDVDMSSPVTEGDKTYPFQFRASPEVRKHDGVSRLPVCQSKSVTVPLAPPGAVSTPKPNSNTPSFHTSIGSKSSNPGSKVHARRESPPKSQRRSTEVRFSFIVPQDDFLPPASSPTFSSSSSYFKNPDEENETSKVQVPIARPRSARPSIADVDDLVDETEFFDAEDGYASSRASFFSIYETDEGEDEEDHVAGAGRGGRMSGVGGFTGRESISSLYFSMVEDDEDCEEEEEEEEECEEAGPERKGEETPKGQQKAGKSGKAEGDDFSYIDEEITRKKTKEKGRSRESLAAEIRRLQEEIDQEDMETGEEDEDMDDSLDDSSHTITTLESPPPEDDYDEEEDETYDDTDELYSDEDSSEFDSDISDTEGGKQAGEGDLVMLDNSKSSLDDDQSLVSQNSTGNSVGRTGKRKARCTKATPHDTLRLKTAAIALLRYAESEDIYADLMARLQRMIQAEDLAAMRERRARQNRRPGDTRKTREKRKEASVAQLARRLRLWLEQIAAGRVATGESRRRVEHEAEWARWVEEAARTGVMHVKGRGCRCRTEWRR